MRHNSCLSRTGGFTLVELIVVMVLLAIMGMAVTFLVPVRSRDDHLLPTPRSVPVDVATVDGDVFDEIYQFAADMGGERTTSNAELMFARGYVALAARLAAHLKDIAGVDVPLTVYHEGVTFDVVLTSTDRARLLKAPRLH